VPDDLPATDVLDALIDALAAAPCGNRELDVRLDYGIGVMLSGRVDVAGMMIREGVAWQTVSATIDSRVPAYTTSVDAAVEGENVVFSIRSDRRNQWGAMHRARSGKEVVAWAATEPLARRLAALRGLRVDAMYEAARRSDETPTAVPHEREARPEARHAAAAGAGDWKILF
jgi:hypothetical protein